MPLASGALIGPYEVLAKVGEGGMGEVYRARDTRLGRTVAIKIIASAALADGEARHRFLREARTISSLAHPHVCTLFDVGSDEGVDYLVMEYLEGDTLAQRLARSALPIGQALTIGIELSSALDAAHREGLVHRDLKPGNVMLTKSGVKLLDFGLAKPRVAVSAGVAVSAAGTISSPLTGAGSVVGTVQYMAPEQVEGREADARSDIFAFGAVLFELLTGRRAFESTTQAGLMAAIVERTPPMPSVLQPDVPPLIDHIVNRCLSKDPDDRWQTASDLRQELQWAAHADSRGVAAPRGRRVSRLAYGGWAAAAVLAFATATLVLRSQPQPAETRFEITAPGMRDNTVAVAPDGRAVVFLVTRSGRRQLWLRDFGSLESRALPGTDGAITAFWSPAGDSIGFFALDAKLKVLDVADGAVRTITGGTPAPGGGSWNRDGTIVYSASPGTPMFQVPATGGEPTAVTRFEAGHRSHASPHFLPDGRRFLFHIPGTPRGVYLGQLDSDQIVRLFDADSPAVYAMGHLFFTRETTLWAQPFDADTAAITGMPVAVAANATGAVISAAPSGPIVFSTPSADSGQRALVWVDRTGAEFDKVTYADRASQGPALSPDGNRLAFSRFVNGNMDIWSYETRRRTWDRLTSHPGDEIYPLWSIDGRTIVFGSRRGQMDLYRRSVDDPPGSEALLVASSEPKFAMDWSRDGRVLLYQSISPQTGSDIWASTLEANPQPIVLIRTEFNETQPQFSPDGQWIAYQSNRTGRDEIYLRRYAGGGDTTISTDGGAQVRWNPDGNELFFIAADDRLMSVAIRPGADGSLQAGQAVALFVTNVGSNAVNTNRQQYSVSPDGRSFVMHTTLDQRSASPVVVIQNWRPAASR